MASLPRLPHGEVGKPTINGLTIKRAMTPQEQIERLTQKAVSDLKLTSTKKNPYYDKEEQLNIYQSEAAQIEAWTNARGELIQIGPLSGGYERKETENMGVAELRNLAVSAAVRMIPDFRERLASLHPLEANDMRSVYFYRFEDLSCELKETELPPFVQLGLYPNGEIASYANTLTTK